MPNSLKYTQIDSYPHPTPPHPIHSTSSIGNLVKPFRGALRGKVNSRELNRHGHMATSRWIRKGSLKQMGRTPGPDNSVLLSRPVWCKFQRGKDDILVMKFRGLILDEIWSWIWIWRWIWSWIWSWILIWTLIWTCIWIWTAKH